VYIREDGSPICGRALFRRFRYRHRVVCPSPEGTSSAATL
jgi:hypothetical protein